MLNSLQEKINIIKRKLFNRETITYIVAGVLTTVVNYIAYYAFCNMGIENLISNVIAWIIAVIFAYIVNDLWVFQSQRLGIKKEIDKIIKFFGARVFSLVIEEAGILLFVNIMQMNNMIVKAALAVVVIIMNYFFSKLFIFKK